MTKPKRRKPIKIDDARLIKLWHTSLPDKELAIRLNHWIGVIRRRAKRLGLKLRRNLWSEYK